MRSYDGANKLKEHVTKLAGRQCFSSDFMEMLRLIRVLLEAEGSRDRFPTLCLYCDWAVHSKLDRNPSSLSLIERVGKIYYDHRDDDPSVVIRQIGLSFGFAALRSEMTMVFMEHDIPRDLLHSMSNWNGLLSAVLHEFEGKPIRLPKDVAVNGKGRAKAAYENLIAARHAAGGRTDLLPTVLGVENRSDEPGEPGRPAGFYWVLQLWEMDGRTVELNGPLLPDETRADFDCL